jgi:hypothetical protein
VVTLKVGQKASKAEKDGLPDTCLLCTAPGV